MNLLSTAVVDITTLVAACHALKCSLAKGEGLLQRRLLNRLRRDIKRGTIAYIDALARAKSGAVDDALLAKCRVAAELQMPHALARQELLGRIMANRAGSLDGLAATPRPLAPGAPGDTPGCRYVGLARIGRLGRCQVG